MKFLYAGVNKSINKHPFIKSCINFSSGFCPYMVVIFYSLYLLKIYIAYRENLLILACEPIFTLAVTLIIKLIINRRRPFEKYNFMPINDTIRHNYSFPSIQAAMTVSIALAVLRTGPNMGLLLSTLAVVICICRILSGNHYISDVLAGASIALIINIL